MSEKIDRVAAGEPPDPNDEDQLLVSALFHERDSAESEVKYLRAQIARLPEPTGRPEGQNVDSPIERVSWVLTRLARAYCHMGCAGKSSPDPLSHEVWCYYRASVMVGSSELVRAPECVEDEKEVGDGEN